jgi:hypothetical protein
MQDDLRSVPSRAADFFLMAQLAFAQSRATRHPQTARVLANMGRSYMERAKAFGLPVPEDVAPSGFTEPGSGVD